MQLLYNNIPALLTQRPNWVVWGVRDSPPKSPFNPASLLSGRPFPAKAGVPETWDSFHNAVLCVEQGLAQGIGYEFDGSVYGVDLDSVIDEAGAISPQAKEIVGKLNSYTEISPSGKGLHIFVLAPGANISRHRKKDYFLEIYKEGRYFTVTGNSYRVRTANRDTNNICNSGNPYRVNGNFLGAIANLTPIVMTPCPYRIVIF